MKATEQLVHDLKKMYLPQNRFANFGNVLLTLDVNGIRGMSASMSMEFPITVIIGYFTEKQLACAARWSA